MTTLINQVNDNLCLNLILRNKNAKRYYFKSFFVHLQLTIMTHSAALIIASFRTMTTFIGTTCTTMVTR